MPSFVLVAPSLPLWVVDQNNGMHLVLAIGLDRSTILGSVQLDAAVNMSYKYSTPTDPRYGRCTDTKYAQVQDNNANKGPNCP